MRRGTCARTVDARPIHQPPQPSQASTAEPWNDIALWIHSPGGSVPAMLALQDLMRVIPNDVSTLASGIACSAGQFLLSSEAPSKRRALPHSRIIVHQGSAGDRGKRGGRGTAGRPPPGRSRRPRPGHPLAPAQRTGHLDRCCDRCWRRHCPHRATPLPRTGQPDSKVQLSVNCATGDLPRHRNHLCGAGTRCRSRPARRGSRREAVRTATRLGRAPPTAAKGQGAFPELILQADEVVRTRAGNEDVLTVHSGHSVDRLRAGRDHDRVLMARQAQQ